MRDGFYRQTARVEGHHWWFRHRRRIVTALLDQEIGTSPGPGARALDVGCGTGGNLETIGRRGYSPVGIDRSSLALELARHSHREATFACVDANRLGDTFAAGSFDLVTVLNVLYHEWIADETDVLEQVRHVLRPDGWLLLTEPAFEALRRRHDRIDLGIRRYSRRHLVEIVEGAGFAVRRATYFNAISFLPAAAVAAADRYLRGEEAATCAEETGELSVPPGPINRWVLELCRLESFWLRRVGNLPFGVGVLVLARPKGAAPARRPGSGRDVEHQVGAE